jgi:hypothetical protein
MKMKCGREKWVSVKIGVVEGDCGLWWTIVESNISRSENWYGNDVGMIFFLKGKLEQKWCGSKWKRD